MRKRPIVLAALSVASSVDMAAAKPAPERPFVYGENPAAGAHFEHDGARLYYEVYGSGQPLLMIHGNGGSIWSMKAQIAYFSRHYRVIAMDSRDHGRSGDSPESLTYEAMSDDLAALIDHLRVGRVNVLGWSDGAIEALMLGMRHPDKINRIAAMAPNLDPSGLHPEFTGLIEQLPKSKPGAVATREERVADLIRDQPNIEPAALARISAPTLVIAGDHDLVADEHMLTIYHHLPNGQLAIFPGATHALPAEDPEQFNAVVDRFFTQPLRKIDRIGDLMKLVSQAQAALAADRKAASLH